MTVRNKTGNRNKQKNRIPVIPENKHNKMKTIKININRACDKKMEAMLTFSIILPFSESKSRMRLVKNPKNLLLMLKTVSSFRVITMRTNSMVMINIKYPGAGIFNLLCGF